MDKLDNYTLKYIFNLITKEWDKAQKENIPRERVIHHILYKIGQLLKSR